MPDEDAILWVKKSLKDLDTILTKESTNKPAQVEKASAGRLLKTLEEKKKRKEAEETSARQRQQGQRGLGFGRKVEDPSDILKAQHLEEAQGDIGMKIKSTRPIASSKKTIIEEIPAGKEGKEASKAPVPPPPTITTTTSANTTTEAPMPPPPTSTTTTTIKPPSPPPAKQSEPPPSQPSTKAPAPAPSLPPTRKPSLLKVPTVPPKTMYELETNWRSLRRDMGRFADYLKVFKPGTFPKVFKESSNPEVISDVFRAVRENLVGQDAVAAKRVMEGMAGIGRFKMMVMMLSAEDKARISESLDLLEGGGAEGALHSKFAGML